MKNMKKIVLYGAGGHGKVVADAIEHENTMILSGFLDDTAVGTFFGLPILGTSDTLPTLSKQGIELIVVTIGNAQMRKKAHERIKQTALTPGVVRHPSAQIARGVTIGLGTVILAGVLINPDAHLGEGCIINTGASVDHDCILGDFVHISPGTHVAGGVSIGDGTHIGIGSSIKEGICIGRNAIIGAGSVVVKDIPDDCIAYGVPAEPRRSVAKNAFLS